MWSRRCCRVRGPSRVVYCSWLRRARPFLQWRTSSSSCLESHTHPHHNFLLTSPWIINHLDGAIWSSHCPHPSPVGATRAARATPAELTFASLFCVQGSPCSYIANFPLPSVASFLLDYYPVYYMMIIFALITLSMFRESVLWVFSPAWYISTLLAYSLYVRPLCLNSSN